MRKWFYRLYLRRMARRYDYDTSYLFELLDESGAAFRRFIRIQQLGGSFSGGAPRNAWFAAGIAGALVEDCGPCVQIGTDMAVEAGMPPAVIAALLSGAPTDSEAQLGFDYGGALLTAAPELDTLRAEVERRWGKKALIGLTLRVMTGRNFPILKRALGHARSCQKVRVGTAEIAVAHRAKVA
ncbi:MAG: hypothetical protein KGM97_03750 [Alphaproteobacteria bacterium]|nr:hypothetical protein [Alphaproteobacteria bacterium]